MITIHAGGYRAVVLELNTGSRGLRVRSDPLDGGRACKPLHTVACVDVPCHPALLCPEPRGANRHGPTNEVPVALGRTSRGF
jgi:hypothetical protein